MVAAHRRHDMSDVVWERLRAHLPGGEGKRGRPAHDNRRFIARRVLDSCAPALLGAICPRTMEIGRIPTVASAAGGTGGCGLDCWRR